MKKRLLLLMCLLCLGGCAKKEESTLGEQEATPVQTGAPELTAVTATPIILMPTVMPTHTPTEAPTSTMTPMPSDTGIQVNVLQNEYSEQRKWFEDEEAFLQEFGFAETEPFYEYYNPEGKLEMVFYYDELTQEGLGICYSYGDWNQADEPQMSGFTFKGITEQDWEGWKMDYTLAEPWEDADMEGVEDYQEYAEYDAEGRMTHFEALGEITWLKDTVGMETILSIDFSYYDNGNLKYRKYFHSPYLFSSTRRTINSYFDEDGRLLYERGYITHGSLEDYYIYKDEDTIPEYLVTIDYNCGVLWPTIVKYRMSEEENSHIDVPTMTHEGVDVYVSQNEFGEREQWYSDEASFLEAYGLMDAEPFYEYYDDNGIRQMTLYYNEETQFGLGIVCFTRDPSDISTSGMYGFTFEGIEENAWEGWETDYSETLSYDGDDGRSSVDEYEEHAEYDATGRITHFESQGIVYWLYSEEDTPEVSQLLWIDYTYYDNGNLKYRYYWHNSMVFSSTCATQRSYFDEQGRLLYEYEYLTHGNWDEYYIYLDGDEIPEYCLALDHNCGNWCPILIQYEG